MKTMNTASVTCDGYLSGGNKINRNRNRNRNGRETNIAIDKFHAYTDS